MDGKRELAIETILKNRIRKPPAFAVGSIQRCKVCINTIFNNRENSEIESPRVFPNYYFTQESKLAELSHVEQAIHLA